MSADPRAAIDTNVLVYAVDTASVHHPASKTLYDAAVAGQHSLRLTTQVLLEYVAIVTNPKRVASPISAADAWADVDAFLASFPLLAPDAGHVGRVISLGTALGIKGPEVFDLSIAAVMLGAGVSSIYTFDSKVFSRVPGVVVHTP